MGIAIGELLPLAVAIAISVTTIITTVFMLLSPKAKSRSVGLLVGCVVGVGGAVAVFTLLADLLPTQSSGRIVAGGLGDHDGDRGSPCAVGAETVAKAACERRPG